MSPNEQLHSFTGTLTFDGKPITTNYNRLTQLILNKETTPTKREEYRKQLERIPEHITTADNVEPELLYFQKDGDRYLIRTRGPGRYTNHLLSMEGPNRAWSAYSGTDATGYAVTLFGRGRDNITLDDLITDQLDIIILAGGRRSIRNYGIPGAPAAFTDNNGDYEAGDFQLTVVDRNVAP
ncbi:hypothetical protein IB245_10715 [Pseudomonas sp. PDM02]|uniref:hypothetical protein n=1 Tax=Pseudomonas sp. PDM02 TaxID=2769267 RepID=UPI00177C630E|nr:hypothetical protein [Pseudomonas sp. PDM02]MBD9611971.1 hypothetical protein [Pseudomonas sp. PDM02]